MSSRARTLIVTAASSSICTGLVTYVLVLLTSLTWAVSVGLACGVFVQSTVEGRLRRSQGLKPDVGTFGALLLAILAGVVTAAIMHYGEILNRR